jgi:predicted transcriptional regulator
MGHTLTVRLDKDLAEWLEREARRTGVAQGRIVRDQLEKARRSAATQRFMRLAGAVRGGPRDVSTRKGFSRG